MGSMFQGSTNGTSSSSTGPWAGSASQTQQLVNNAGATANSQLASGYPFSGSDLYSADNSQQLAAGQNMYSNGSNALGYANGMMSAGAGTMAGLGTAQTTGTNLASGNFNQGQTGASTATMGNTQNAVNQTNQGINGAMTGINNNTASNVASQAGQLINNSTINGQVQAMATDVNRGLSSQINQLNAGASASGNNDSTRAGVAQGVYEGQANENLTNATSNLMANAYNQGTSLAEGMNQSNINGSLSAANSANSAANTGLYGQSAYNSNNQANQQLTATGANLLNNGAATGSGIMTAGNNMGYSGASQQLQGGGVSQTNQQNIDNANVQAFTNQQQYPWTVMGNEANMLRGWGSSSSGTTSQTQSSSPFSTALGAGAMLAAFM